MSEALLFGGSLVSLTPFPFPAAKAFSVLLPFLTANADEDEDEEAASALQNSFKTICNLHSLTPLFYRLPQVVTVCGWCYVRGGARNKV